MYINRKRQNTRRGKQKGGMNAKKYYKVAFEALVEPIDDETNDELEYSEYINAREKISDKDSWEIYIKATMVDAFDNKTEQTHTQQNITEDDIINNTRNISIVLEPIGDNPAVIKGTVSWRCFSIETKYIEPIIASQINYYISKSGMYYSDDSYLDIKYVNGSLKSSMIMTGGKKTRKINKKLNKHFYRS